IEVTLTGNYTNDQQLPPKASPGDPAYEAAHPVVSAMIPGTAYSAQGGTNVPYLSTAAGVYASPDSGASYSLWLKYNNKGTSPQGQVMLVLPQADGSVVYVKSNSITSLGFTGTQSGISKDATVYTKASIYRILNGVTSSVDGNVTLRVDAHDGCPSTSCT